MAFLDGLFGLVGKTALVTGSTRGLGFVIARGFARAGAHVVLNGRNRTTLDEAVRALRDEGLVADGVVFDVTDSGGIGQAVRDVESRISPIDILVNNAGIQIRAPLEVFAEDDFRAVIDINLVGPFLVSKAVVKGMIARGGGKIINICSLMSEITRPTIAPYAASKGGLKMLTRGMAVDWAKHGIQVNGIGPGYFATEMNEALVKNESFSAWIASRTPAGRWGDPEELVGAAVFLASSASSFMNGQIIYVDGGILSSL